MTKQCIPKELEAVRELARRAVSPIKPADTHTKAAKDFDLTAARTDAGRTLPVYYLVYFLLVDLLEFPSHGHFEKVAWSVCVDFEGVAHLIEHRKFGLGIFATKGDDTEARAEKICQLIRAGVEAARPFFKWIADNAVANSYLNVHNSSVKLLDRFSFFLQRSREMSAKAKKRRDERNVTQRRTASGTSTTISFPAFEIAKNASWLAMAAIDAFFSWTEHIFIHLAILQGRITTAAEVAKLADANWPTKFKTALDITDTTTKKHLDELIVLRRQLRNFMAHGAFGKAGEAFNFHSGAGAVPVVLDHRPGMPRFSISPELAFDDKEALAAIERFIDHLWSGSRAPAKIYLQEGSLPLILPMASDGTYQKAMASVREMEEFVDHLGGRFDQAANMDW